MPDRLPAPGSVQSRHGGVGHWGGHIFWDTSLADGWRLNALVVQTKIQSPQAPPGGPVFSETHPVLALAPDHIRAQGQVAHPLLTATRRACAAGLNGGHAEQAAPVSQSPNRHPTTSATAFKW